MKITVLDETGAGIPDAVFLDITGTPKAVTNLDGITDAPAGDYTIKHIGYKDEKVTANKEKTVVLTPQIYETGTVEIIAERAKSAAFPLIVLLIILYALSKS